VMRRSRPSSRLDLPSSRFSFFTSCLFDC
jgi:hypothetical protein